MKLSSRNRPAVIAAVSLSAVAALATAWAQEPQGSSGAGSATTSGEASGARAAQHAEEKSASPRASGQKLAEEQFKNDLRKKRMTLLLK